MNEQLLKYNLNNIESNFQNLYGEITKAQIERYEKLFTRFKSSYGVDCAYFASSSGRVEVCGNHTDHNGGRVVSCAISLDTVAAFLPNMTNIITVKSEGYDDIVIDLTTNGDEKIGTSAALVRGVAVGLLNRGYKVGGFDACFTSNVLGGAGISSSASFELLVAEILNFLYNDGKVNQEEKAKIAQFSENVYFGKPCGLLDQTAISFGGLKRLDFVDPEKICVKEIQNSLPNHTLVLINTGGSHADLTDEYAAVPREMFDVAKVFGVKRLIDITQEEFFSSMPDLYNKVSDRALMRAIHFYQENERVDCVFNCLNKNDYATFLEMINQSGISSLYKLQNCFVPGRKEQPIPKALSVVKTFISDGACRVHGGGFAGSILVIVSNNELGEFVEKANSIFGKDCVVPLKVRSVGATILK